jgi:hypothetical protein
MYGDNRQIQVGAFEENGLIDVAPNESHGINEDPGELLIPSAP